MDNSQEPASDWGIGELRAEFKQEREKWFLLIRQNSADPRIDAGVAESDVADMSLRSRISALESRVTDIERRINQPPPQTH